MKRNLLLMSAVLVLLAGCKKGNEPAPTPDPITVTDICGNTYNGITIGSQTWMSENLRCKEYDTESEA